jgi:hypothetical protein
VCGLTQGLSVRVGKQHGCYAEGSLAKELPNGVSEVTLILNGKVLENGTVLRGAFFVLHLKFHDLVHWFIESEGYIRMIQCGFPIMSMWCTDLRPNMGNPEPDTLVTFHVVVRPAKAGRGSGVYI